MPQILNLSLFHLFQIVQSFDKKNTKTLLTILEDANAYFCSV